ncbi:putative G-protein coupled receptor F59B2.13 [Saccostrea echinata]|uniref:putative G-protein coupled receptor F59B2.13 n=1 Tax=Saccostrea echinata TaxID=191078 RepID=UPI002A8281D9|nr:putative G-protein coupled receptor F59B2.13 [Saccostrea echinata]
MFTNMENVTESQRHDNSTIDAAYNSTSEPNDFEELEEIGEYLWRILSPVIFIVGITGNIIIIIVLKKMNFKRKPPYMFLFVLSLFDMTVLCVGLSQYWVQNTFHFNLRLTGQAGCKISLFVIYWSMQCSSWILVCVVFERFLKIRFPLRYMRIVTIRKCVCLIILVMVILSGIDMHLLITNGIKTDGNETECTSLNKRYLQYDEYVFIWIDFTFLSALPFLLMISMNVVMIRVLRQSRQFRRNTVQNSTTTNRMNRFDRRLTIMLLVTSIYFLSTTAPIAVYFIVDSYVDVKSKYMQAVKDLIWASFYLFQFTNYAMNFILYNLSNQRFRKKLLGILKFTARNISFQKGSTRSVQRGSVYSVDVTETSFGSEPEHVHQSNGSAVRSESEESY